MVNKLDLKLIIILALLFIIPVYANNNETIALSEQALFLSEQIQEKELELLDLKEEGFTIVRYNDTLLLAKQFFAAQKEIESHNGTPNYNLVETRLNELTELRELAYLVKDELTTLEQIINASTAVNITVIYEIYDQAYASFRAERYEESLTLIERTYVRISEQEATETRVRALYDAYSRNLTTYLKQNYKNILITIGIILLLILISQKHVRIFIINKKIKNMEVRVNSVRNLVAKTQKDYFEEGTLNESMYHTKVKKYGEILRDLNRQIPLLKEQKAMILKKGDKDEKEKKN
ncbi:MAG: hypothetical protein ACMXYG_05130 [Candidatus Woesearchaeota archaeon]